MNPKIDAKMPNDKTRRAAGKYFAASVVLLIILFTPLPEEHPARVRSVDCRVADRAILGPDIGLTVRSMCWVFTEFDVENLSMAFDAKLSDAASFKHFRVC